MNAKPTVLKKIGSGFLIKVRINLLVVVIERCGNRSSQWKFPFSIFYFPYF